MDGAAFEKFFASRALSDTDAAQGPEPLTLSHYLRQIHNYGARQHFMRGETIFAQGDDATHVYRVVAGMVRLCRYMPDGRRYITDFLMPGDLMGFVENPLQPVCAEAVGDVTLVAFPRICFDELARRDEGARNQLLCHLSQSLSAAQQHLFVLGCQKARERVASFLLRLSDRQDLAQDERLDLMMPRQDIADHLGLTIETISRTLSGLRADGIILLPNTHQIVLRDKLALRALAAEA